MLLLVMPIGYYTLAWGAQENGLVAYYPFNGNANDESGMGNNGTTHYLQLTTDRFNVPNSAYRFFGNKNPNYVLFRSSYIDVPDSTSLRCSNVTVNAWVKPEFTGIQQYMWPTILTKRINIHTAPYNSYILGSGLSQYSGYLMHLSGGRDGLGIMSNQPVLIDEEWQMVTLTIDNGMVRIYHNGNEVGYAYEPTNTPIFSSESLLIGTAKKDGWQDWWGIIDEIRIYNRALSGSEINALYNLDGKGTIQITPIQIPSLLLGR